MPIAAGADEGTPPRPRTLVLSGEEAKLATALPSMTWLAMGDTFTVAYAELAPTLMMAMLGTDEALVAAKFNAKQPSAAALSAAFTAVRVAGDKPLDLSRSWPVALLEEELARRTHLVPDADRNLISLAAASFEETCTPTVVGVAPLWMADIHWGPGGLCDRSTGSPAAGSRLTRLAGTRMHAADVADDTAFKAAMQRIDLAGSACSGLPPEVIAALSAAEKATGVLTFLRCGAFPAPIRPVHMRPVELLGELNQVAHVPS